MIKRSNRVYWAAAVSITLLISLFLAYSLLAGDKSEFLLGQTSHGHFQIELACESCHSDAFSGEKAMQKACESCHADELKRADDSHPKKKFLDPRNADRLEQLDALQCKTCHREHKPGITGEMGVTLPIDYCFRCHEDIAEDRKSHADLEFDTCASAGCHNYHDNKALYEDFLVKHGVGELTKSHPVVLERDYGELFRQLSKQPVKALSADEHDAPENLIDAKAIEEWQASGHADAGVNCSACHYLEDEDTNQKQWLRKPDHSACESCHSPELEGFTQGRHGMRLAQEMSPMKVSMAKIAMKEKAHNKELNCQSCHGSHSYETKKAAVDACMSCHDDEHTKNFKKSPHYDQWVKAQHGDIDKSQGVSCATCHLPRMEGEFKGETVTRVQHNQNDNLRPNEKMIRSVCMNCHGLGFSIDSLADQALVDSNFVGQPRVHITSIEWALKRDKEKKEKDRLKLEQGLLEDE